MKSDKKPRGSKTLAALVAHLDDLEQTLHWTQKRLLTWELLIWQLYQEIDSVKTIVDGFFKAHSLTELELKAHLAQAGATEICILDQVTGAEKTVLAGDRSNAYWEQQKALQDQEPEEFTKAFREEGGEAYGEVVKWEMEHDANK